MQNNNITSKDLQKLLANIEQMMAVLRVVSEELKCLYLDLFSNYIKRED